MVEEFKREDHHRIAEHFMELCIGGTSGHMAEIPHSPALKTFVDCFVGIRPSKDDFAKFLEKIAISLKEISQRSGHDIPW